MVKRCIKCWCKVSEDPIIISEKFDGCFCKDCYDDSAEELIRLVRAFNEAPDLEEAYDLFSKIDTYSENLDLSEEGQDFLFGFLSQKLPDEPSTSIDEIDTDNWKTKKDFIAVTSNTLEGYRITEYHGIASGASVMGQGAFASTSALGTEKNKLSKRIEEVKNQAMNYAIDNAISLGGNALIATNVNLSTITTAGGVLSASSVNIAVMVSGTSVTIEKIVNE